MAEQQIPTPLSVAELAAIRERHRQLSPDGPWETGTWDSEVRTVNRNRDGEIEVIVETANDTVRAFIAHVPEDIPALLATVDAYREMLQRAAATCETLDSCIDGESIYYGDGRDMAKEIRALLGTE